LFEHFDRDIRNLIYGYLSIAPLAGLRKEDANGLALACRQADHEVKEEGARQLWVWLQKTQREFIYETGHELLLPQFLTSKDALAGLADLIVIVKSLVVLD
jgi:hypothetical protein